METTETPCYYSQAQRVVIDLITPTGLTQIARATEEQIRQRYPDAERMSVAEAVLKIEAAFVSQPVEVTEEQFTYALEVLPPQQWITRGSAESFKMSEYLSGAITTIYARIEDRYFSFNDRYTLPHDQIIGKCRAVMGETAAQT